jgi:hypothetical protein
MRHGHGLERQDERLRRSREELERTLQEVREDLEGAFGGTLSPLFQSRLLEGPRALLLLLAACAGFALADRLPKRSGGSPLTLS